MLEQDLVSSVATKWTVLRQDMILAYQQHNDNHTRMGMKLILTVVQIPSLMVLASY